MNTSTTRKRVCRSSELYNLDSDISESTDVAAQHPEVVRRLRTAMNEFEKELAASSRPVGVAANPRTLLPRPGVEGDAAYAPTLSLEKSN